GAERGRMRVTAGRLPFPDSPRFWCTLPPLGGRGRHRPRGGGWRGGGCRGMREAHRIRTERARRLRREATKVETILWNRLRSRSVGGFKFVRQEPIGRYVADFVCRKRRLIIELDGGQHATSTTDEARTRWHAGRGYRIIRFWNNELTENLDGVLNEVVRALQADTPPHPRLRRDLSPQAGRGEEY